MKSKEKEYEKKLKEKEKDIVRLEKGNKHNTLQCKELKRKCDILECGHEQFIRSCENKKIVGKEDASSLTRKAK